MCRPVSSCTSSTAANNAASRPPRKPIATTKYAAFGQAISAYAIARTERRIAQPRELPAYRLNLLCQLTLASSPTAWLPPAAVREDYLLRIVPDVARLGRELLDRIPAIGLDDWLSCAQWVRAGSIDDALPAPVRDLGEPIARLLASSLGFRTKLDQHNPLATWQPLTTESLNARVAAPAQVCRPAVRRAGRHVRRRPSHRHRGSAPMARTVNPLVDPEFRTYASSATYARMAGDDAASASAHALGWEIKADGV
jgi:hypothetical protein